MELSVIEINPAEEALRLTGMTQEDFCEANNLNYNSYSQWLRGRPVSSPHVWRKLMDVISKYTAIKH